MVIKLLPKKTLEDIQREKDKEKTDREKFTEQDVEDLFSRTDNWDKFWNENKKYFQNGKADIYNWVVFPLCRREGPFYRCMIHREEEVNDGPDRKPIMFQFRNIHLEEFISHCIYYRPEEHKQYIKEILFGKHNE